MVADRVLTDVLRSFAATVAGDFTLEDVLSHLAHGAVQVLGVDGAGVMVPKDEELLRFAFAAGPSVAAVGDLERLQEALRAGPCAVSHRTHRTVNLADLSLEGSWPEYQALAVRSGLRAVATVPLLARGRSWGVLDVYRAEPRRLDEEELRAVHTLAQVATSYFVVTADRDAARDAQYQLAHRAMHDPLTGVPVRWVFLEQLEHALARLRRHAGQVGVLFADLDGLKHVNDTYGHDAGDRLLMTAVDRIRAAVRPSDVVARVGGDEFVVLLEDLDGAGSGTAVARRIQAELAKPYRPSGPDLVLSASLGLALTSDPTVPPSVLVAQADSAMYDAKRAGRGRFELFDPSREVALRGRGRQLEHSPLRSALRDGELVLHYQPVIALDDRSGTPRGGQRPVAADEPGPPLAGGPSPGRIYAVEALARWQHPDRGLLTAQEFLPQAERDGLLPELGAWVLAAACQQLARWDRALGRRAPARLFVNTSVDQLVVPGFVAQLSQLLLDHGVVPERLTVEITETGAISDSPAATRALTALHELGCPVAIDDFATGWSSLGRLVELPATTWKIDRAFTRDLAERPSAAAVVSAVVELGRRLDRTVVAEGVEDDATLRSLRSLGCTHAQGYHLGRPQPATQISELLAVS